MGQCYEQKLENLPTFTISAHWLKEVKDKKKEKENDEQSDISELR